MLKISVLEKGLDNFLEGYKSAKNAVDNCEVIEFNDKSIGFQNGVGFYTLLNFRKVRNYKKVRKNQFCYWHMKTKENPKGTDCLAHMYEGRVFECPYSLDDLKYQKNFSDKLELMIQRNPQPGADGVCRDFVPKKGIKKKLTEIAKENMKVENL